MASWEKILGIEVTHVPAGPLKAAHIRVTGVSGEGKFTLRVLNKLRHDKIAVKVAEAERLFGQLVGLEVEVMEVNYPGRSGKRVNVKRRVVASSLPKWARGKKTVTVPLSAICVRSQT